MLSLVYTDGGFYRKIGPLASGRFETRSPTPCPRPHRFTSRLGAVMNRRPRSPSDLIHASGTPLPRVPCSGSARPQPLHPDAGGSPVEAQFLKLHWEVLAATDFFTVEVAIWRGLATYYVLVVMELATRRVQVAGMTPHPRMAFMQPCARQLTDPIDGFLLDKRYLLHDRDTKFTQAFDELLKDSGVELIVLPPRNPNLNTYPIPCG
jgi:hypothetical protein